MMNLLNQSSRRDFLRNAILPATAFGLFFTWRALRSDKFPDPMTTEELEAFALQTQKSVPGLSFPDFKFEPDQYSAYEALFGLKLKPFYKVFAMPDGVFPGEVMRIVDVGGSSGSAISTLGKAPYVEPFVIDMNNYAPGVPRDNGLPANRFIARRIEETGLPDGTFHHAMAGDSVDAFDWPSGIDEMVRIIRPGGTVVFDTQKLMEDPNLTDQLVADDRVVFIGRPLLVGADSAMTPRAFKAHARFVNEYGSVQSKLAHEIQRVLIFKLKHEEQRAPARKAFEELLGLRSMKSH